MIARFFCHRVSQLLAVYMSDVLQFRIMMNPETPQQGFLFGNTKGPWVTDRITKVIGRKTLKMLGTRITFRDYRQINVGMNRKFLQVDEDDAEEYIGKNWEIII